MDLSAVGVGFAAYDFGCLAESLFVALAFDVEHQTFTGDNSQIDQRKNTFGRADFLADAIFILQFVSSATLIKCALSRKPITPFETKINATSLCSAATVGSTCATVWRLLIREFL